MYWQQSEREGEREDRLEINMIIGKLIIIYLIIMVIIVTGRFFNSDFCMKGAFATVKFVSIWPKQSVCKCAGGFCFCSLMCQTTGHSCTPTQNPGFVFTPADTQGIPLWVTHTPQYFFVNTPGCVSMQTTQVDTLEGEWQDEYKSGWVRSGVVVYCDCAVSMVWPECRWRAWKVLLFVYLRVSLCLPQSALSS